eukprot:gene26545-32081_t
MLQPQESLRSSRGISSQQRSHSLEELLPQGRRSPTPTLHHTHIISSFRELAGTCWKHGEDWHEHKCKSYTNYYEYSSRKKNSTKKKPYPNDSSRHQAQQHNGKDLCMIVYRSTFCRSLSVEVLVVVGSRKKDSSETLDMSNVRLSDLSQRNLKSPALCEFQELANDKCFAAFVNKAASLNIVVVDFDLMLVDTIQNVVFPSTNDLQKLRAVFAQWDDFSNVGGVRPVDEVSNVQPAFTWMLERLCASLPSWLSRGGVVIRDMQGGNKLPDLLVTRDGFFSHIGTNNSESSSRASTPVPELPLVAPLLSPLPPSAPSPPEPLQTETSSTPLNLILTADELADNPAAAEPAAKSPSIIAPASSPVPNDQLCVTFSGRADVVGVWIKSSADDESVQDISNVHCLIELKAGVSANGFRSGFASAAVEQLIFQLMACLVANKSRLRICGAVTNLFGLHMVECYRTEAGGEITCSISPMVSKAKDVVWALLYLLLDGQQGDGDYYSRSGKVKGEEQVSPGGESAATLSDYSDYGSDDDQGFSSSEEGDAGIDDEEYDGGIHDDEEDDCLLYGSEGVKRRLSFRSLADGQIGAAFDL